MQVVDLFIPCIPAGQPRAKATSRGGHAAVYTPQTKTTSTGLRVPHPSVEMRAEIKAAVRKNLPDGFLLISTAVSVDVVAWFSRAESKTKRYKKWERLSSEERAKAMAIANPIVWHIGNPDRDNLDKAMLDCLTGVIWDDDTRVCAGSITKLVAPPGMPSGIELLVTVLPAPSRQYPSKKS